MNSFEKKEIYYRKTLILLSTFIYKLRKTIKYYVKVYKMIFYFTDYFTYQLSYCSSFIDIFIHSSIFIHSFYLFI